MRPAREGPRHSAPPEAGSGPGTGGRTRDGNTGRGVEGLQG